MDTPGRRPPISAGEPAPDFTLPVVNQDGTDIVSLATYGVPQPALTPEILQAISSRHVDLARELQIPATDLGEIKSALCRRDGFEPVDAEQKERRDWSERNGGQFTGQFLIDRNG